MKEFEKEREEPSPTRRQYSVKKVPNTIKSAPPPLTSHNEFSFWTFLDCFSQGRENCCQSDGPTKIPHMNRGFQWVVFGCHVQMGSFFSIKQLRE